MPHTTTRSASSQGNGSGFGVGGVVPFPGVRTVELPLGRRGGAGRAGPRRVPVDPEGAEFGGVRTTITGHGLPPHGPCAAIAFAAATRNSAAANFILCEYIRYRKIPSVFNSGS